MTFFKPEFVNWRQHKKIIVLCFYQSQIHHRINSLLLHYHLYLCNIILMSSDIVGVSRCREFRRIADDSDDASHHRRISSHWRNDGISSWVIILSTGAQVRLLNERYRIFVDHKTMTRTSLVGRWEVDEGWHLFVKTNVFCSVCCWEKMILLTFRRYPEETKKIGYH